MPPELRPRKETPTPCKPAPAPRRSRKTPLKLADYFTAVPAPSSAAENNDSSRAALEKKRVRSRGKKETDEVRQQQQQQQQHDVILLDCPEAPNTSLEATGGGHGRDEDRMTKEPIFETPSRSRIDKDLGGQARDAVADKGALQQQLRRELDLNRSLGSWQLLEQQTLSKKKTQTVHKEVEVICLDDDDDDDDDDKIMEVPKPSSLVVETAEQGLPAVGMTVVAPGVEQGAEAVGMMTVKDSEGMGFVAIAEEHANGGREQEAVEQTKVVELGGEKTSRQQHSSASCPEAASVEQQQVEMESSVGHTSAVEEVVEMPAEQASADRRIPGEKQTERCAEHALLDYRGEGAETKGAQKQADQGVQESEMVEEEKLEVEDSRSGRPEENARMEPQPRSEPEHGNKEGIDRNSAGEQMATCVDGVEQVQAVESMLADENQGDRAMVDGSGGDCLKENAIEESVVAQDVEVGRCMIVGDREHHLEEHVKDGTVMVAHQDVQVDLQPLVDGEGQAHLKDNPKEDAHMVQDLRAGEVLNSMVSQDHDAVHLNASLVMERIHDSQAEEVYEKRLPSEGPGAGKLHDDPLLELTEEVQGHKVLEEREALVEKDAGDSYNSSSAESEPEDEEAQDLKGMGHEDEAKEDEDNAESFNNRNASEIKDDTDSNDEDSDEEEDDTELIKLVAKSLNTHLKQENARSESKDRVDPSNSTSRTDGIDEVMYIDDSRDRDAADAAADAMHIRWAPKTGLPMIDGKGVADSSGWRTGKGISEKSLERSIWRGEKNLEDGLLVPSLDPRKLRKLAKTKAKDTAGSKWFDMPAPTVTPEIKKELQLLQLRGVMDPKRHYKASDMKGIPKYFQIGTVVEGGADFYSGRLTKKERKGTFADELLADTSLKAYRKRKYKEIQEVKQAGGKKFWKQKKNRQKPSWAKT